VGVTLVVVLAVVIAYTPTVSVWVHNDTSQQATLAECASDPATIDPGQTVSIDLNKNDPSVTCLVYRDNTRVVLGCLPVPTTRYHDGAHISLSLYKPPGSAGC
jgi:hypothetical protein